MNVNNSLSVKILGSTYCYWKGVSEDPGGESLRFLNIGKKHYRDANCKAVVKFY
jgi:hypothetical protein